jgi:heme exporter protein D
MRSRWEDTGDEDKLDEPATITERQLRALKRGALAGILAVVLSVLSLAVLSWSLVANAKQRRDSIAATSAQEARMAQAPAATPAPTEPVATAPATPAPRDTMRAAPAAAPVAKAKPVASTVTASAKPARKAASRTTAKSTSSEQPISVPMPSITPDSTRH